MRIITIALLFLSACGSNSNEIRGDEVFLEPSSDGNSFACGTCHAENEPAADGFTRPGHPMTNVTSRPHYKNGEVDNLIDAVNSCRQEWMNAPEYTESSDEWQALLAHLESLDDGSSPQALSFEIRQPPATLLGGDVMDGQEAFNSRCIVCHGEDAKGTIRGPNLVGDLLTEEQIARRVRTSGRGDSDVYEGLTGGIMPFWAPDRLSDEQLVDVIAFVKTLEESGGNNGGGNTGTDCDKTHPKIGQTANLSTIAHGVSGTATIIDDCTIEVTSFDFDGQGIDVRFYGGLSGNYNAGFSMSENDIRRSGGYTNETITATLPSGKTLDDLDGISVWCVPVGASFGDGLFN